MFERPITFQHGDGGTSAWRIDCYRRGYFVLGAKKLKAGTSIKDFDDALLRARALPADLAALKKPRQAFSAGSSPSGQSRI